MKKIKSLSSSTLEIFLPSFNTNSEVLFSENGIAAGFPSPAEDFMIKSIDINSLLIKNKAATFFARARGNSLIKIGIWDNDLLIVDRSIEYADGLIAVCFIDGEFTAKKIKIENKRCWLMPENDDFKPIEVFEDNQLILWGIVTFAVKSLT